MECLCVWSRVNIYKNLYFLRLNYFCYRIILLNSLKSVIFHLSFLQVKRKFLYYSVKDISHPFIHAYDKNSNSYTLNSRTNPFKNTNSFKITNPLKALWMCAYYIYAYTSHKFIFTFRKNTYFVIVESDIRERCHVYNLAKKYTQVMFWMNFIILNKTETAKRIT